jgi:nitrite reductase (NADH) large subunit
MDNRPRLVVAGNGMVGHRLCRKLVELGATGLYRVTVLGEEPQPAYDRVHLTDLFGERDDGSLQLSPPEWYREHEIDLRLNNPVVRIERQARLVRTRTGDTVEYDQLVLATGSSSFVPPIAGTDLAGVFVYRTIEDLRAIRAYAQRRRRAAVIGGGLLGLEAARALRDSGLATTVIEFAAGLMPSQLTQAASTLLQREITARGIAVVTATQITRIEANGSDRTLYFAAGGSVVADLVVIAAGIRPRSELAELSGVDRSPAGGIVVDNRLRTSDPNIYAIGECASHALRVYGLVAPGYQMADVLATNLAGGTASFGGADVTARLKLLDVEVATAGLPLDGSSITFQADGTYRLLRVEHRRLIGALGVGRWPEFARIQDAVAKRSRIWPWQAARFQRTGVLQSDRAAVAEWSADTIICNCLSVTKGQLASASSDGCPSVPLLAARTGASTLCGSCAPLLAELIGLRDAAPLRIPWALLGGSVVALIAAILVVAATPVPFADTVQGQLRIDLLWREGAYRQVTGFTLLGSSVLAALISFRKRCRRLAFGSFPAWRTIHVTIGIATLAVLAVHTGFRLGHNLNFALMTSFLVVNLVGSLAGGITALEQKINRRMGRALRSALVLAHVVAIWPLPILIAFHVLAVYYF